MPHPSDSPNAIPPVSGTSRPAQVRQQLDRILASPGFQGANRRSRLLRYLVEQALQDRQDSLKESVIATEVFERPADYDPQVDSVVRVEVGRLRSRLIEYYGQGGRQDEVRIDIPKGGYRPQFTFPNAAADTAVAPAPAMLPKPGLPEPGDRRTPSRALRFLVAAVAVIAVAAGAVWRARISPSRPVSIVVLPFLNLSGDPANEYLGDGVSEEVTEALSQSPGLRVVSRTSAFQYKGKSADVREIGQKLGAEAVLEGSIAHRGEQLHLVAQLIRASDGYHLWSGAYDGGGSELPSLESLIARTVATKLGASGPAVSRETAEGRNPEAHDLYLQAAFEFNRHTTDSIRHAMALAEQALGKDPGYAQPYVLMAACESQLTTLFAAAPHAAAARARLDIAKALERDPGNTAAHAQKAMLDYTDGWDWPQAEREFRTVLASGSHAAAENLYGWCLMTRGRLAESSRHLQTAAELDPLALGPQLNQAEELMAENNLTGAQRKLEAVLRVAPGNFAALAMALGVAIGQRDCSASTERGRLLLERYSQMPYAQLLSLGTDAVCGRKERARAETENLLRASADRISPKVLADVYALQGDTDRSIACLEKSAELHEPIILYLKIDRLLDRVRQDPRFVALERRVGLLD